ncbi:MAG: hypothetical protein LBI85_01360 [Spirochaetaceae bacterium]|jgi:hypothetical protein|nr:hypothetical protein [Spirochaetaceae bacterium]
MPSLRRPRGLRELIPFAGALVSFAVFLTALRVWEGPCGYDVYYYALQIKSLTRSGELLFFDASIVYYVLYLINGLIKNPVLSVQLLSSLSMAAIFGCLLRMSLYRGFSFYRTAAAGIAVFNPAVFYLLLEFTKNSFALALFFLSLLLLDEGAGRGRHSFRSFTFLPDFINRKTIPGIFFGLLAVFSHRIILAFAVPFFLHRIAAGLWTERRFRRPLVIGVAAVILLGLLAFLFRRDFFFERMPPLDLQAPLLRLLQFRSRRLWPEERVFYTLLQIFLFFAVPLTVIRRPLAPSSLFGFLAWLCVFPFLRFSWDGTAFRLLIMAPLFAAPWLMDRFRDRPMRRLKLFSGAAGVLMAAGCVVFTAGALQRLTTKGPGYDLYRRELGAMETLAAGRRVIAHRGLAGFLWYEKGVRSENFIPPEEEGEYLRLVYFFSPTVFEPYLRNGEERPLALGGAYTLIEDSVWRRFYQDRRDLAFLRSELNPYLPRPASGFSINERAASLMGSGESPRTSGGNEPP